MKSKLVIWGKDPHGKKVLLAVSLNEHENKVETLVFNEDIVTEELENEILKNWKEQDLEINDDIEHRKLTYDLSMLESILPDGYVSEKDDVLKRAQTEWHFIVLSTKLYNVYKSEVDEIRDRIEALDSYQQNAWDELREFWDKIQVQIYEKNLLRSHAQELKEFTNSLFETLKEKRKSFDKVLQEKSRQLQDSFGARLEEIEQKIEKGMSLQVLFEELRRLQTEFNQADLMKDHRKKLWNKIDAGFKKIKEKRFGESSDSDKSQISRLENRINGLDGVVKRMQYSIKMDQKELEKLAKPSEGPFGILEEQLKVAKRKMIEERINSKQNKLDDMLKTQSDLKSKIEKLREKDESKRLIEEAKKMAELKIAEEIKANSDQRKDEEEKLLKAAEELQESFVPRKTKEKKSAIETAATQVPDNKAADITESIEESVVNADQEEE